MGLRVGKYFKGKPGSGIDNWGPVALEYERVTKEVVDIVLHHVFSLLL